jgi:hypothetical protein
MNGGKWRGKYFACVSAMANKDASVTSIIPINASVGISLSLFEREGEGGRGLLI